MTGDRIYLTFEKLRSLGRKLNETSDFIQMVVVDLDGSEDWIGQTNLNLSVEVFSHRWYGKRARILENIHTMREMFDIIEDNFKEANDGIAHYLEEIE